MQFTITAVVVSYNREALLQECLDGIAAQTRPVDRVVVVDNASTDHALAVAHDHESGEAEATTTLDDLGDTVDGDDALEELAVATPTTVVAATVATASATTAATAVLTLLLARLGLRRGGRVLTGCFGGHFGLLVVTHRLSPPSRAPSAMAATRPA